MLLFPVCFCPSHCKLLIYCGKEEPCDLLWWDPNSAGEKGEQSKGWFWGVRVGVKSRGSRGRGWTGVSWCCLAAVAPGMGSVARGSEGRHILHSPVQSLLCAAVSHSPLVLSPSTTLPTVVSPPPARMHCALGREGVCPPSLRNSAFWGHLPRKHVATATIGKGLLETLD